MTLLVSETLSSGFLASETLFVTLLVSETLSSGFLASETLFATLLFSIALLTTFFKGAFTFVGFCAKSKLFILLLK